MTGYDNNSLARLVNQNKSYEGGGIPPKPQGGFRVPTVDNLRVARQIPVLGGSLVTLTFDEENTGVKTLYYAMAYMGQDMSAWASQNLLDESINKAKVIQGPYIFFGSPITLFLQSEVQIPAFITVTTREPGGVISQLEAQPGKSVIVEPQGAYYQSYTASATLPYNKHGFVALVDPTAAARTMTLPPISQCIDGYLTTVKNLAPASPNTVTVQGFAAAQTIDGAVSGIVPVVRTYMAHKPSLVWYVVSTA
jgi:hypothetical protein